LYLLNYFLSYTTISAKWEDKKIDYNDC